MMEWIQQMFEKIFKLIIKRTERNPYDGIWPGVVEYNADPFGLGRVKVRVPTLHHDSDVTPIEKLPWATRVEAISGFSPIPVGEMVWVAFVNGDLMYPIVFGTFHSVPVGPQIFGQVKGLPDTPTDPSDRTMGAYRGAGVDVPVSSEGNPNQTESMLRGQPDVPPEVRQTLGHEPTVHVPFVTPKGAGLTIQEADGRERMDLHDRSGQGLSFRSSMRKDLNANNNIQRGVRSVFSGTQYDYAKDTTDREATVSLRDLGQQGITMEARQYEERVKIVSKVPDDSDGGFSDFDMGDTVHSIELGAGGKKTIIEGRTSAGMMFLIACDSERGIIEIESVLSCRIKSKKVAIVADRIVLSGAVTVDGELTVAGDATVIGELYSGSPEHSAPLNYR